MQFPFKGKWLEQVAILKHLFFSSLSFYSGRWKSASVRFAGTSTNNVGHLHPGGIGSAREMAKFRNYGLGGGWVCGVGLEALGTSAPIFSNRVSFRRSPFPTQSSCSHRQSRWHNLQHPWWYPCWEEAPQVTFTASIPEPHHCVHQRSAGCRFAWGSGLPRIALKFLTHHAHFACCWTMLDASLLPSRNVLRITWNGRQSALVESEGVL